MISPILGFWYLSESLCTLHPNFIPSFCNCHHKFQDKSNITKGHQEQCAQLAKKTPYTPFPHLQE
jgi:hypothetical protein